MGLRDMLRAIREYPAARAELETARSELRQAQQELGQSRETCESLRLTLEEQKDYTKFLSSKAEALQAALEEFCPRLSTPDELKRFYDAISPDMDPSGFTLYRMAKELTGIQLIGGAQGYRVYDIAGVACTQTAGSGGTGAKTGLYLIPPDAAFVDLAVGEPRRTDTARCLTARYGQTTLSNHRAERSGVLLIKEGTKQGYAEAAPGDSVDLGFPNSRTRAGRVSKLAHDAASVQGIVDQGGRIRRLMPRECLRLQGFAEDQIDRLLAITSDAQAYKQAGNSVTVNVIEAIGRRIRAVDEQLRREDAAA